MPGCETAPRSRPLAGAHTRTHARTHRCPQPPRRSWPAPRTGGPAHATLRASSLLRGDVWGMVAVARYGERRGTEARSVGKRARTRRASRPTRRRPWRGAPTPPAVGLAGCTRQHDRPHTHVLARPIGNREHAWERWSGTHGRRMYFHGPSGSVRTIRVAANLRGLPAAGVWGEHASSAFSKSLKHVADKSLKHFAGRAESTRAGF